MAPKDSNDAVDLTAGSSDKKKIDDDKAKKLKKKSTEEELADTMSDEDKELKERLDTCVSTVSNKDQEVAVTPQIRLNALDVIVTELRTATASMTSVPKPLKFLRPHFASLKDLYTKVDENVVNSDVKMLELRARLADVLAVLAMTMGKPGMNIVDIVFIFFYVLFACVDEIIVIWFLENAIVCLQSFLV